MADWEDLKVILSDLLARQPPVINSCPGPDTEPPPDPPWVIRLAPWGEEIAEDLRSRFGEKVVTMVGFLPLPKQDRRIDQWFPPRPQQVRPDRFADEEAAFELAEEVVLHSGGFVTVPLLVTNKTNIEWMIYTNGNLTASVIDPVTEEIVGTYSGAQTMPLVRFRIAPGDTVPVPLLVGTASVVPELGYSVPPGRWAVEAVIKIHEQSDRRTPPLGITIDPP